MTGKTYHFDDLGLMEKLTCEEALQRLAEDPNSKYHEQAKKGLAEMAETGKLPEIFDSNGEDVLSYRMVEQHGNGAFRYMSRDNPEIRGPKELRDRIKNQRGATWHRTMNQIYGGKE